MRQSFSSRPGHSGAVEPSCWPLQRLYQCVCVFTSDSSRHFFFSSITPCSALWSRLTSQRLIYISKSVFLAFWLFEAESEWFWSKMEGKHWEFVSVEQHCRGGCVFSPPFWFQRGCLIHTQKTECGGGVSSTLRPHQWCIVNILISHWMMLMRGNSLLARFAILIISLLGCICKHFYT